MLLTALLSLSPPSPPREPLLARVAPVLESTGVAATLSAGLQASLGERGVQLVWAPAQPGEPMDKYTQTIERKFSFRFMAMQFGFEVLIVVGVQGRSFGCKRSVSRCQQEKRGRQEEEASEGKRLPSDCALRNARASFVTKPKNLPRFAIGPGFGQPPQNALTCLASFRTRIAPSTLKAPELS